MAVPGMATSFEIITAFVNKARAELEFQFELERAGNRPAEIAEFARRHGFEFSGAELDAYFEETLRSSLSAAELEARADFKRRVAAGELSGPIASTDERETEIRRLDYRPGASLDRAAVLRDGQIVLLRGLPAFARMLERLRAQLEAAFDPHEPIRAHEALEPEEYFERVRRADEAIRDDPELGPIMVALIGELGLRAEAVLHEPPGVRVVLPVAAGRRTQAYYRNVETFVINPHRDTWYGGPAHQLNFWAPVYPQLRSAGIRLYPRYFRRSLANNTAGGDVWRGRVGLTLAPVCLEEIDPTSGIYPELELGDVVCFSANHLHDSGQNTGDAARVSVEFRMISEDDRAAGIAAPNVDYFGHGEIYLGWISARRQA